MTDRLMNLTRSKLNQPDNKLDGIAIFLSGTCLLHCLTLPILITLYPISQGSLIDEQYFHLLMLILILPISLAALTIGCRRHKDLMTIILGSTGLILLTFTALFGHDLFGPFGERVATTLGGLILAAAHIQNFRCCRAHDCQH